MAILNKIRERSLVLILVIAMALFAFVLADVFKNNDGFSLSDQNVLATVNDLEIDYEEFEAKVKFQEESNNGIRSKIQSMNLVWDEELRRVILKSEFNKLGISVQKDQMSSVIENNFGSFDDFKNQEGFFDVDKLNEFVLNLKEIQPEAIPLQGQPMDYQRWIKLENNISQKSLETNYFNMINSGLRSTLLDAKINHHFQNDNADIKFVYFPFTSIPDSLISISKSEIKNYVNDNPKKYSVDNSRDFVYVKFDDIPSDLDKEDLSSKLTSLINDNVEFNPETNKSETKLGFKNTKDHKSFLEQNSDIKFQDYYVFKDLFSKEIAPIIYDLQIGDIHGPYSEGGFMKVTKLLDTKMLSDSTEVRHVLISYTGSIPNEQITRTRDQAKITAVSIYNLIQKNRNNFSKVLNLSSDTQTLSTGGLRKFHYNQEGFGNEFKDFSFNNNIGKISVIESVFGFHVVEILSRTKKSKAVKVADLAFKIESSDRTLKKNFNLVSKFKVSALNGDFRKVAKENEYIVKPVNSIKELDENVPGVFGTQRKLVKWLFNSDTNVGDINIYDTQQGGYVVAMLTSINEEGLMSNEKASISASPILKNLEKSKIIINKINSKDLESIASSQNVAIQTARAINISSPTLSGVGKEPKVIGSAFSLNEGETSKAIVGNNGVFYIYLDKLTKSEPLPSYFNFAKNLGQAKLNNLNSKVYESLKELAEIEDDNRSLFY